MTTYMSEDGRIYSRPPFVIFIESIGRIIAKQLSNSTDSPRLVTKAYRRDIIRLAHNRFKARKKA